MIKRPIIYLPLIFSLLLAGGIWLGMRLTIDNNPHQMLRISGHSNSKLDNILSYIESDYVDEVNRKTLENEAIAAMIEKLDPHSDFITAEEFHEMNDPLLGKFEGIGVSFRIEKDTITVISPLIGGPSEKVGIMAGDRIIFIEDTLVAGVEVTNRDAMRKLKGDKGTKVRIKVLRRGIEGLIDFTITRDVIPTFSLDIAYMLDAKTGFIRLNKFSATTHEEFMGAVVKLLEQGMQQLVLDLRGNTGGFLSAARDLTDEFLTDGKLIVYTEGKNRPRSFAFATKKGLLHDFPVAVLIDEGSASASEIVAGALQDNDRGIIVGRRSFGKGLVQEQLPLPDGSAVRLTVARYYTPTGRSIQKPYNGDKMEYHHEAFERYENGELMHPDSIHFADSLKYTTPKGKIVYGGGGIMPDVYVPLEADSSLIYYNRLANSGLLFQFAFEYADTHRPELNQYGSPEAFVEQFRLTDKIYNELVAFA
ncbi:MAG TPA: S41 family peptidase, partial [Bacteroidales bacterium]|nr:S41 family peptidase [Bacteroidales bacterium]